MFFVNITGISIGPGNSDLSGELDEEMRASHFTGEWETRWSNGWCAGLQVERSGFEPWPGHYVVFLTLIYHSACLPHHLVGCLDI